MAELESKARQASVVEVESPQGISLTKALLWLSGLLNLIFVTVLIGFLAAGGRAVVTLETPAGTRASLSAAELRREMLLAHGKDTLRQSLDSKLAYLATNESGLALNVEELETRYYLATQDPDTRARLDLGTLTERELRHRIERDIRLDELTMSRLTKDELEEALRTYYAHRQRDLEEIRVRHIVVSSQREAEDVSQRLVAGVDFAPLAQRYSLDPLSRDQGGDLGWKKRRDLPEELGPLLFLIPPGRVSNPISTKHGWNIFMIEEKRGDFESLRDTVRREWCRDNRPDTLAELKRVYKVDKPEDKDLLKRLTPVGDTLHLKSL